MQRIQQIRQAAIPNPALSIVIAAYNAEEFILEAVLSILAQPAPDFELIIIDDASTDETLMLADSVVDNRVTLLHMTQREYVSVARNLAASYVRAPWMCVFDADDTMEPNFLAPYFANITAHPEAECGYCALRFVDEQGRPMRHEMRNRFDFVKMIHTNILPHPMALIKTDLFHRIGGYDESLPHSVDYDLWLKIIEWTTPAFYNHYGVDYRRHPNCIGQQNNGHHRVHELMQQRVCHFHLDPVVRHRRNLIRKVLGFWDAISLNDSSAIIQHAEKIGCFDTGSFLLDHYHAKALIKEHRAAEAVPLCDLWITFMMSGGFLCAAEAITLAELSINAGIHAADTDWLMKKALPIATFTQQHMQSPALGTALQNAQRYLQQVHSRAG